MKELSAPLFREDIPESFRYVVEYLMVNMGMFVFRYKRRPAPTYNFARRSALGPPVR